jgi:hypothetical protein
MEIKIAAERPDLPDMMLDIRIFHKRIAFGIAAERAVQVTGIRDFQIDAFHVSILTDLLQTDA